MADTSSGFDPANVDLNTADPTQVVCFLQAEPNDFDGRIGARISAVFVILAVSTAATCFPVMATRMPSLRIPKYVYLFARYFGAGVIIATAFIHLLDPAYSEIGPQSCVGMTGGWAQYSWPPCIALVSVMLLFLVDFASEWYVEGRFGLAHSHADNIESVIASGGGGGGGDAAAREKPTGGAGPDGEHGHGHGPRNSVNSNDHRSHQFLHSGDQDGTSGNVTTGIAVATGPTTGGDDLEKKAQITAGSDEDQLAAHTSFTTDERRAFYQQFIPFLVLEFGVLFHSVIIGLNLGVAGSEFSVLYPVLVFHQSFEGLGIGARLSDIPFPHRLRWAPWALCAGYGLTTPIATAIGIGLSTSYQSGSFTASVVSGVLDSISAGILIYTGLVELLARDFLFNPERTRDKKRISFMLVSLYLGIAVMALLGKWA